MKKQNQINKQFLNSFCNYNKLNNIILSFDIDWAPEFMIEDLLNLTSKLNPTFFNTHKSKILKNINEKNITQGIHPNLQNNSSHGHTINNIYKTVKNFGNKKYLRFHVLGHSYPDLKFFAKRGTEIDSSIILINQPYITPNYHPDIDLVKVPYVWEDGMILNFKFNIKNSLNLNLPGLKILDFHPLDLYLNTPSIEKRNNFKKKFKSNFFSTKKESEKYINKKKYGIRDFFIETISYLKRKRINFSNFKELNYEFRENKK